jgi:hypothetical protein
MTTYRITTNGTIFRLEMFDSTNNYLEWVPCSTHNTLAQAKAARVIAERPPDVWTPVEDETDTVSDQASIQTIEPVMTLGWMNDEVSPPGHPWRRPG